jgi:hypothetical protein
MRLMDQLTYDLVQRQVNQRLLRYTFARGQGGPLVFLWVVGTGLFTITWNVPEYAAICSAACLIFGILIGRDVLRDSRMRAMASRELLVTRFPSDRFADSQHRESVTKAVDVFVELLGKLSEVKRSRGLSEDVAETVSEMDRLVTLQCESVLQVEELDRILRFVGNGQRMGGTDRAGLHEENVAAIRREVNEAESLIALMGQRLETLLLQVYRADSGPADAVSRADGRRRSAEALDRLQQIVDARRESARQLIDLVDPGFGELDLDAYVAARTGAAPLPPATVEESLSSNGHEPYSTEAIQPNGHTEVVDADLVPWVEEALKKLNNPAALASCELIQRLPCTLVAARAADGNEPLAQPTPLNQAHLMREALSQAIERLRPGPTGETDRTAARPETLHYDILYEEYVQGMATRAIMLRHSVSESTFHRYRRDATRTLAHELSRQEQLLGSNGHRPPVAAAPHP